jgi:hypothetical protein
MFDNTLFTALRFVAPVEIFWDEDMLEPVEEANACFPHISLAGFGVRAKAGK